MSVLYLSAILSVCSVWSAVAAEVEMRGVMQYDASESVVPDWLTGVGGAGLFRFSLHKVWERRRGVDANVTVRNVKGGEGRTFNLKRGRRLNLPAGRYRVTCDTYDISVAERQGEREFCISRESVFDAGSGAVDVLFYPKGSSVTVKGRVVDAKGRPLAGVEVYGTPDLQSDAYFYNNRKTDGSPSCKTRTDADGVFVFENEPPAAVELGVHYLLTGKTTRPMQSEGEVALDFCIHIPGYCSELSREDGEFRRKVKLLAAANLPALRKVAEKLRASATGEVARWFEEEGRRPVALPASTNNVVYVGDVVVRARTTVAGGRRTFSGTVSGSHGVESWRRPCR